MAYRRNSPLTPRQASVLQSILAAHGYKAGSKKTRRVTKHRRISASHRRKLLANLRKARAARRRGR